MDSEAGLWLQGSGPCSKECPLEAQAQSFYLQCLSMAGFMASKATELCIQVTTTHQLLGADWGCGGMGSHGKRAPSPLAAASGSSQVLPGAVVPNVKVWHGADLLALKRFVSWGLPPAR